MSVIRVTGFRKLLRVLVTFAVRSEFAHWRRLAGFKAARWSEAEFYQVRIDGTEIRVFLTGVGCRSRQDELRKLLVDSDLCVVSGLAGALRREYGAGTLLVARAVKRETGEQEFSSDPHLVDFATKSGAAKIDYLLTTNSIINSPAEKHRLGVHAAAVDMESFTVFQHASELKRPAVAVRAISDDAETHMPIDFNRLIDERGEIGLLPAVVEVAKQPRQIPNMIRFGAESSRAARNLAVFLDRYIRILANEGVPSICGNDASVRR